MNKEMETITARQLRKILFYTDETMTIGELRKRLFDVRQQDKEVNIYWGMLDAMAHEDTPNPQAEEAA
jgi:hypothetical protein